MNKPKIIITEQPKINVTVEYNSTKNSNLNPLIQQEKDELNEMKKIRAETGLSLGRLIELRKKGYKIVRIGEKCKCH